MYRCQRECINKQERRSSKHLQRVGLLGRTRLLLQIYACRSHPASWQGQLYPHCIFIVFFQRPLLVLSHKPIWFEFTLKQPLSLQAVLSEKVENY